MASEQIDPAKLMAYIHDELPPAEAHQVEQLIKNNAELRREVEALSKTSDLLHSLYKTPATAELSRKQFAEIREKARKKSRSWRPIFAVGGLLAAATIAGLVLLPTLNKQVQAPIADRIAAISVEPKMEISQEKNILPRQQENQPVADSEVAQNAAPPPPPIVKAEEKSAHSPPAAMPVAANAPPPPTVETIGKGQIAGLEKPMRAEKRKVESPTSKSEFGGLGAANASKSLHSSKQAAGLKRATNESDYQLDSAADSEQKDFAEGESIAADETSDLNIKQTTEKRLYLDSSRTSIPADLSNSKAMEHLAKALDMDSICAKALPASAPSEFKVVASFSARGDVTTLNIEPDIQGGGDLAQCLKKRLSREFRGFHAPDSKPFQLTIQLKLQ